MSGPPSAQVFRGVASGAGAHNLRLKRNARNRRSEAVLPQGDEPVQQYRCVSAAHSSIELVSSSIELFSPHKLVYPHHH